MKHFTITKHEQADALRPFRLSKADTPEVGDVVSPIAGVAAITSWAEYPEADALTFEQCMAIVKDDVTEDVLRELGGGLYFENPHPFEGEKWIGIDLFAEWEKEAIIQKGIDSGRVMFNGIEIPNPTATKIRLLTQILRGQ